MPIFRRTAAVYVDGLNLYRRCLEGKPDLKWLNLLALSQLLLPTHDITTIRYFSSRIRRNEHDTGGPTRQMIYWRALRSLGPIVSIDEGRMVSSKSNAPRWPRTLDEDGKPLLTPVQRIEEKGSDVALGVRMALDAASNLVDIYCLVSSDSDFLPVVTLLRSELKAGTALFSPTDPPPTMLRQAGPVMVKVIRRQTLEQAQFPDVLEDEEGIFTIPHQWKKSGPPREGVRAQQSKRLGE
jgi:uncharacterized LabA/DUF88 family protein